MKYCTKIIALNSEDELVEFAGPIIEAISFTMAKKYCEENGMGYCRVSGRLTSEIPCDDNYNPDLSNEINHDIYLN